MKATWVVPQLNRKISIVRSKCALCLNIILNCLRILGGGGGASTRHYHSDSSKVSLIMFYLNMVDYPMFFISMSTCLALKILVTRGPDANTPFRILIWDFRDLGLGLWTGTVGLGHITRIMLRASIANYLITRHEQLSISQ